MNYSAIKNIKINKKPLFLILIFELLFCFYISCETNSDKTIIEADLTFNSISFMSAYGASEEQIILLKKEIDSIAKTSEDNETKKLYRYFDKLNQHGLLKNPYIFLRINEDSILPVYLTEKEYNKIKDIKHIDLVKGNKKAIVKLELSKVDDDIYYSNNIIKIKKVNGESRSNLNQNN